MGLLDDLDNVWTLASPMVAIPARAIEAGLSSDDSGTDNASIGRSALMSAGIRPSGGSGGGSAVMSLSNSRSGGSSISGLGSSSGSGSGSGLSSSAGSGSGSSGSAVLAAAGIRSGSASQSDAASGADPNQSLMNAIQRLAVSDPQSAQDLMDKYGPDLQQQSSGGDDSVLGRLKRVGGSLVTNTLTALNTPLNVVRGTIKEGPGSIPDAVLHGKDFGNVLAPEHGGGIPGFLARFGEDVVLDPTTYVTAGTSAVAKSSLKSIAETGGKDLAESLAKSGVRQTIEDSAGTVTRDSIREMLLRSAEQSGQKNAEKFAGKQFTALERGAAGGVKIGLPFTEGRTLVRGSTLGPVGQAVTEFKPVSKALSAVGKAFVPRQAIIENAGRAAADILGQHQTASRVGAEVASSEFTTGLKTALKETGIADTELNGAARQVLEGTADRSILSPEATSFVERVAADRAKLLQRQLDAGTIRPDQVLDPSTYVPIQLTDAGRKAATHNPAGFDAIMGKAGEADNILRQGGSLQHRAFENIDQAEKVLTDTLGPLAKGGTYVEHNPARALALRDAAAERAISFGGTTGHSLVDGLVRDLPGLVTEVAGPGAKVASVAANITKLQSTANTIKGRIKYVEGKLASPVGGASRFVGQTDKMVADPVANLGMIQHRMNLTGKLQGVEGEIQKLRDSHAAEAAAREASIPVAPAGQVAIKVNEAGRHIIVPDWMAPEINRAQAVITNDETLKTVQKAIAGINHYWKSMVTVLPVRGTAFQSRNAVGNVALMVSRGWTGRAMGDATVAFKAAHKGKEAVEALSDPFQRQMAQELVQTGVLGSGFIKTEVLRSTPDLAGKGASRGGAVDALMNAGKHHFAGEGKAIQAGHRLNSYVEDFSRAQEYVDLRRRGADQMTAALETKKALFDYSDLTPFEKHAIGPFVAFYTFMRKNLGAQLWTLTHNPGKLTAQAHGYEALAGSGVDPMGVMPQYSVDRGDVPMGGILGKLLGGGNNPVMASLDLPMNAAINTADPLIKGPKLAASFIPGLKGLRKSGDIGEFGRTALNTPSGPIIDVLRSLAEGATHKSLLTGNNIPPGAEDTRLEEALLPPLGAARRSLAKVGLEHSTFGKAIGARQDGAERASLAQLLLGMNVAPLDDAARKSEEYRRLREAEDKIAALKAAGVPTPTLAELKKLGLASSLGAGRRR